MDKQYDWGENYKACRLQLDFLSYIKFSAFIGFCFGVVMAPVIIFLVLNDGMERTGMQSMTTAIGVFFIAPLTALLNGAFNGLVSFFFYRWLVERKKGQTYTGIFVGLTPKSASTQPPSDNQSD